MSDTDGNGFLNRWSERKRRISQESAGQAEEAIDATDERSAAAEPDDERSDAEILEQLDLPDPDILGKGDDFTKFMTSAVPARLRNRALRRLWLTNPVLANLDELLDYGDDFTDAATVVENMKTVYDSVRGMLPEEVEDDPDSECAGEAEQLSTSTSDDSEADGSSEMTMSSDDDIVDSAVGEDNIDEDGVVVAMIENPDHAAERSPMTEPAAATSYSGQEAPLRPQRMRFRFDS